MPANSRPNGRFELPSFTPLNYSLTDGTDIPPPRPDSPIEENPRPAPRVEPLLAAPTNSKPPQNDNGHDNERGRPNANENTHASPTLNKRPSSIRRFLSSKKSLNANYTNGNNSGKMLARPESAMSFASTATGKKNGSWLRWLLPARRSSVIYDDDEQQGEERVSMGPPPPRLPELDQLKAKVPEGMGADDMFKNIE